VNGSGVFVRSHSIASNQYVGMPPARVVVIAAGTRLGATIRPATAMTAISR